MTNVVVASALLTAMDEVRTRTLGLVAHLSDVDLDRTLTPLLSPLAWDLGHIAAYEDLWLNHRLGGHRLVRAELAELYDAFDTPRAVRGDAGVLRGEDLRGYMVDVRERALEVPLGDGMTHELVLRHELQHTETMLQTMALAGRLPDSWTLPQPVLDAGGFVAFESGEVRLGAGAEGFAYDNERPRHRVDLPAFRIARRPVTNATWLSFTEVGGYARREWWCEEGWAWKREHRISDHAGARAGDPDAPVVRVSWFEACALARAYGARLPTEGEWEAAATSHPLSGIGEVWEWTGASFVGYPGFRAHPYREYSEVFFGGPYRVLRGWSCAAHPRVASGHFRNWDRPEHRHLFAGLRLAEDA